VRISDTLHSCDFDTIRLSNKQSTYSYIGLTYFMDHEEAEAADEAAAAAAAAGPQASQSPTFTLDGWSSVAAGPLLSLGYR
jgi:hypothetical protein